MKLDESAWSNCVEAKVFKRVNDMCLAMKALLLAEVGVFNRISLTNALGILRR
jgi:hypothetical protein